MKNALKFIPIAQFGKLTTVDKTEIESYRSIKNLMLEYISTKNTVRPLSIAVFGTLGSGKSFGILEVANSIAPTLIKKLDFNLSQFRTPMQDGVFREGDSIHPIELSIAEQNLIEKGMNPQELRHLCDIHMEVLKGELDKIKTKIEPGHVVYTFIAEHDKILEFLTELEEINSKIQKLESYDSSLKEFEALKIVINNILDMITKELTIGEVLRIKKDAPQILMNFGMGCVGCPSSQAETIEDAAKVHGLNLEELIEALNK